MYRALGADPDRWHYIDKWVWNGSRWERHAIYTPDGGFESPYYMAYSHPVDALRVHETAGGGMRVSFSPTVAVRCFFWDAASMGWRPCEWS